MPFSLHAAEAVHGELGAVTGQDVCVLISNSGETEEVLVLLPRISQRGRQAHCGGGQAEFQPGQRLRRDTIH